MKSQVVLKLQQAKMYTEPFNHMVIEDFLPQDAFTKLADIVDKTNSGFKPDHATMEHQRIIDTRETVENNNYWEDWYSVFESNAVTDVILERFGVTDIDQMRCDIHKCESVFYIGCQDDVKDNATELISLQIYITENDDDNGVSLWDGKHKNIIKHIENKPNTAWLFKAHPDSWHSVQKCTRDRQSLLMKYLKND